MGKNTTELGSSGLTDREAVTAQVPSLSQEVGSARGDEVGEESDDLVEEDLLVEEISIDGMCGVY